MIKIPITTCLLFLLLTVPAITQPVQNFQYFIEGQIKGINHGCVKMFDEDGNVQMDSVEVKDGKFTMQGSIHSPERRLFIIKAVNSTCSWSFRGFVEKGSLKMNIDTAGAERHGSVNAGNCWYLIWEINEAGSYLYDVYNQYEKETNKNITGAEITALYKQLKTVQNSGDSLARTNKIDSLYSSLSKQQKLWVENYINQNPTSVAGVFILSEIHQSGNVSAEYLQHVLYKFSGQATGSVYYTQLLKQVSTLNRIKEGMVAPGFSLSTKSGSLFTLSSTAGKYTMLDFWASWCIPCRKAIPGWKKLYEKYGGKGFTIVSVASDSDAEDWVKALDKENMPWTQVRDKYINETPQTAELYGIKSLPFYVLIDKEGKIIFASNDEVEMARKIEEALM